MFWKHDLLTGMIASYVANDPSQIVVLPTDDDCRDYPDLRRAC